MRIPTELQEISRVEPIYNKRSTVITHAQLLDNSKHDSAWGNKSAYNDARHKSKITPFFKPNNEDRNN